MKIALDAGHGWENRVPNQYDPGAVANGTTEADVVLQLALTGKWVLEQQGIPVFLTRPDDRDSNPVSGRNEQAQSAGCTHQISLHMNAGSWLATGTETYYRGSSRAGQNLASMVQHCALSAFGLRDRGLKLEGQSQHPSLAVLDFRGAACLLEAGFITNRGDLARVSNRERRIDFWERFAALLNS